MESIKITNLSQELPGPLRASFCNSFACRLRGLMFRPSLSQEEGLLLVQNQESRLDAAIHMFFMGFDIAAIWLDAQKKVVDAKIARRWRPYYMPQAPAQFILEVSTFWIDHFNIGDQVDFEKIIGN